MAHGPRRALFQSPFTPAAPQKRLRDPDLYNIQVEPSLMSADLLLPEGPREEGGPLPVMASLEEVERQLEDEIPAPPPAPFFAKPKKTRDQWDLPMGAKPKYDTLYTKLTKGERAPAIFFAEKHKDVMKTVEKGGGVWVFNAHTLLWTLVSTDIWKHTVAEFIDNELNDLLGYVKSKVDEYIEDKATPDSPKALWKAAMRKVTSCLERINMLRGLENTAKFAYELLLDPEFVATFDNIRFHVSFRNGVLDLRTLELCARTAEHRLTYALPYDWDPDANTTLIETFVHSLFEDKEAERAFQITAGLWFSGDTSQKRFWQWSCPSNGAKTSTLRVLTNPMGKYASVGMIGAEEFGTALKFQDLWYDALAEHPPPRLIAVDEIRPDFPLSEDLLNQATDGSDKCKIQLARKGIKGSVSVKNHAKYLFLSNHVLRVNSASTGLVARNTGHGFRFRFVTPYDKTTAAPNDREADPGLVDALLDPSKFPGIAAWACKGAKLFVDGESPMCPRFEKASFDLHVRGDQMLAWLSEKYVPTGNDTDKVELDTLVRTYRADYLVTASNTMSTMKALMETFDFILPTTWYFGGAIQKGYAGIRERIEGDPSWVEARALARDKVNALRALL